MSLNITEFKNISWTKVDKLDESIIIFYDYVSSKDWIGLIIIFFFLSVIRIVVNCFNIFNPAKYVVFTHVFIHAYHEHWPIKKKEKSIYFKNVL